MNQPWGIEPSAESALRLALLTAMQNGTIEALEKKISEENITSAICGLTANGCCVVDSNDYSLESLDIPDDSVALIWVEGIIYPWKSFDLENKIAKVNGNPKLLGALMIMNTPGGAIHRVDISSNAITNSKKPIATYATGVCASSGMWLASGSKRIFAASVTDRIGSIGIKTTFRDMTKYMEEMGIVEKDIYATLSSEKDAESRAMKVGDDKPIIANLDFVNDVFHKTIATNRKIKLDPEAPIFKGAIFNAQEAISNGLIDQIGTLDEALTWVITDGLRLQANSLK